jgi:CBS domain-containing protein
VSYIAPESRLSEVREKLVAHEAVDGLTVRTLLRWFGAARRGLFVARNIEKALTEAGLETFPDFNAVHIDSPIVFKLLKSRPDEVIPSRDPAERIIVTTLPEGESQTPSSFPLIAGAHADPAFRLGRLASANSKPISVSPDCTVAEAVTLLLRHDFSQLPVMTNARDVKGVVSWESIGARLALRRKADMVRECLKPHYELSSSESLFRAISQIVEHSYVLVRGQDRTITGIVTTADLSLQFQQLSEPFLLLSEIENHVRLLIDGKFTSQELASATDQSDPDRRIESVADLTFGEYIRILEDPTNWLKVDLAVDKTVFIKELDKVRRVRNDVMHFDPDGITEEDHRLLRDFMQFMNTLRSLSS